MMEKMSFPVSPIIWQMLIIELPAEKGDLVPTPASRAAMGQWCYQLPIQQNLREAFYASIPWETGTRAGAQPFLQAQKPLFQTSRGNARFGVAKYLISGFILLLHINFSGVCLAWHVILDRSYVHRLQRVCESLFCCSYWAKSRLLPGTHAEKSVIWEQMVWLSEWEKERETLSGRLQSFSLRGDERGMNKPTTAWQKHENIEECQSWRSFL